jgi:hypothetical protein
MAVNGLIFLARRAGGKAADLAAGGIGAGAGRVPCHRKAEGRGNVI